jgi:sterol desaturase/sphingolipid hydroxylase (fatty acid hydroxylase superfamily)
MDWAKNILDRMAAAADLIVGPESRVWPFYIVTMLLICFVIYRRSRVQGSFLRWVFPAHIYKHKSHWVDIKLFLVGRLLGLLGVFNAVVASAFVASLITSFVGPADAASQPWHPFYVALLIVLAADFGVYWVHRVHHEYRVLWPFHSVHHSAEVMTPITAFRKHPLYDLTSNAVRGVILGVLQGVLLAAFVGEVQFLTLLGVNIFYVTFNFFGSNIRHSHIWLSYGPALEHILISPAQHQVHHSLEPRHFNKNYGEVFAIWDWMFGTLYVLREREQLEFGLGDEHGNRIQQPHDTLWNALIVPIKDCWRYLTGPGSQPSDAKTGSKNDIA